MHLLLFVRERNEGKISIKEIGDFTAHNNERTRGAIEGTFGFFNNRFQIEYARFQ